MTGLQLIDRRGDCYAYRFHCPCGRLSTFAVRARDEDTARQALQPVIHQHLEREAKS